MEKVESIVNKYWFVVLVLLIIPAVWSLTVPGFYGASDDMHPAWVQQLDRSLKLGNLPPRMAPDLSFGFGYPLWNFISPLPFYVAELVHLTGFNFVDSVKITFGLATILAALSMYFLLRGLSTSLIGLAAATLYTYTPYRAVDIYVRGAMGEIWAFVFFPVVLLSIIKRWPFIGGLSISGLILSHNIGTYMFLPPALLLGLFLSQGKKRELLNLLLMFGIGILGSIYFWLPALLDSQLMRYDTLFNFADHYPVLRQLITPYWGYGGSHSGPDDGMSFFLGITNLLVLVGGVGMVVMFYQKLSRLKLIIIGWSLLVFVGSVFMMNFRSVSLWIYLPMLDYFQFPWRFLMMTTVSVPMLLVLLDRFKPGRWIAGLIIILAVLTTTSYFKPEHFLGRNDEYYLKRYIPIPLAQSEYSEIQEEYLRLPQSTQIRPDKNYPVVNLSDPKATQISQYNGMNLSAIINSENGTKLQFNKYYFPGWRAWVNNQEVEIKSGEPFNQMIINIPKGQSLVDIKFTEVGHKIILDVVSLLTIVGSILILFKRKFSYG